MDVSPAEVIGLANDLLQHVGIAKRVTTIRQCNSILFTQLYGVLTGTRVPGIFPRAPSSEAVKCQAVVDALCEQLSPHISLDHICGTDLARPDLLTVRNLLDIFSVLFSLPNREGEGEGEVLDEQHSEADDSNVISSEGYSVISEVIREELGPSLSMATDSTAELLRPVPRARVPRMARPPHTWWEDSSISSMTAPSSSLQTSSSGHDPRRESTPASSDETGEVYVGRPPQLEITALTSSDTDTLDCQVIRHQPPIVVPSSSPVERRPSPPSTPPHQRLHVSPLHHSTPHTSTRSRVFGNHHPPSTHTHSSSARSGEIPQVTNVATPAPVLPVDEYYTELTHPPRLEQAQSLREPVHLRQMPHSAPAETRAGEWRERGTQTGESSDYSPALVPAVSSFVQTESPPPDQELGVSQGTAIQDQTREEHSPTPSSAHTSQSEEGESSGEEERESEDRTPSPRAPLPRPRVHFSTSTQQRDSSRQEEPSMERTRLDEQMARTRTNVLATLYQNYLRELQASQPRKVGTPPPARRGTPTARRKASSGYHYRRTALPTRKSAHVSQTGHSSRGDGGGGSSEEEEREQRDSPTTIAVGDDILPLVEREFPFVHVSPATMRRLWQKQLQQITALTKPAKPQSGRPNAAKQVAEMGRRHQALLGVIKKELDHTRRLQQRLELRREQQAVKANIRARRQAAARARKYFSEYELRLKSKLQKRRTREEQIFRRVFEDGLDLQRARVRELRKYSREKQQTQARRHQEQLESLENYYRDQFAMLAESTAKERESVAVREKAQHQLVQHLHRELRERLEREIRQLQESLDREEEVAHFRELDAQQLRHKLSRVTFTTAVK